MPPFCIKARKHLGGLEGCLGRLGRQTRIFQDPDLAGAEGIEPPTSGFGDQRSAN